MAGQRYIDEVLLPHVRLFRGAVGDKFVFMDDNATCHRTLAVQDCLDSEGIQRLVWPARSPDLNPIENVWDALGRQVAGRNNHPTNKNTLIRALTEEWDKMPQQLLDNVVQNQYHVENWYELDDEASCRLRISVLLLQTLHIPQKLVSVFSVADTNRRWSSNPHKDFGRYENLPNWTPMNQNKTLFPNWFLFVVHPVEWFVTLPGVWVRIPGHLLERALDWYQIFGSALVQNTATDFLQLKAALSKAFPAIQNRKDLETRFYAPQQRQNQEPTDFVYDLLKLHKKGNYENSRQGNQWFESRNRFQNDDRRFNDRGYQFRSGSQKDDFSREDDRNRGSSETFSRGNRRQRGRLNVLKVGNVESDQTQSANKEDKFQNIGVVELNIRIREFEKPWLFHVFADLEYPYILGIDFIGGSKIILDFDRKTLAIPDSEIDKVVKVIEEEKELWFQQDGATCHTARATIDLLKDTFGGHLISRFGPVNWPPRSCDFTPLDYFMWGYVKSLVYADKPQTLDHLEDNIHRVIADIRPQMLEKVIENWTSRLDYIRASRGSHMAEIIFKM
ncbi:uncharacterized protein TNCV_1272011 [Trichonephila clavipes]|nr:uncharacterized protein TNCV_1272011 [Trichonephila clavipes]